MSVIRQTLLRFKSILINSLAWVFILCVYGFPLILLALWRTFVNLLASRLHSDLTPCSPNDTLLVYETPDKQPIVAGGIILKVRGDIDAAKLKILFEELFLSAENFGNYQNLYCDLVKFCGYLFKREIVPKVKLANHFQEKILGSGEDFKGVVSSWFQEKFQKGLPLWQLLVLHGSSKEDVSYMAFKAHHVLMDGYSFVHILDKLTGVTSPGEWSSSNGNNNNSCAPKEGDEEQDKTFWTKMRILFSVPEVVASFTFPNVSLSTNFPKSKCLSHFEMLPMACASSALQPVKEVRRKLGVHFPAIVYGLQVGILRAALLDGRGNVSGKMPMEESALPESVLITTSLPVIGVEHPRNKLTNHWSGGFIKIPLKTSSPKQRILEANKSLESILKDDGTYITWKYLALFLWIFPSWFHFLLNKCQAIKLCKYRASMSCIPQSCHVQYNLMGLPVENVYHAPVMKDSFLTSVLLGCSSSHHEQVDFSMFGHPDWFPDQEAMNQVMASYMKMELETLAKECEVDHNAIQWRLL